MPFRLWFRPPRQVLVAFLAITLIPAAALAWLGWRLLEQERSLEGQRVQERLEHAADRIAAAFERRLSDLEDRLPGLSGGSEGGDVSGGASLVVGNGNGIDVRPGGWLLYHPVLRPASEPASSIFAAGEALEYRENSPGKAAKAFRQLARSPDSAVRAGALVRLARNLRKAGRRQEALAVYTELATLGPVPVTGLPAELVALEARCTVFDQLNQRAALRREASALYTGLQSGRWKLTRAAYEFHTDEAERWMGGAAAPPDSDHLTLADSVEWLWRQWSADPFSKGRRFLTIRGRPALVAWAGTPARFVALCAGPQYLEPGRREAAVRYALADSTGQIILGGTVDSARPHAVRTPATTKLPWTLYVSSVNGDFDKAGFASRRRILLAGFILITLLILAGSYFVLRAMMREMAVARLQSDFVAAVSHEFRSPLTSLRQLSELLAKGRVQADAQRRQAYGVLVNESERLHRLVEGLLDFGRMEAGASRYRFERLNPGEVLEELAAEFRSHVCGKGYAVDLAVEPELPLVRADREALGRAVWNLLDNAVKYSPDSKKVWIDTARNGNGIAIRVKDGGIGIPAEEQKEIFKKFFRGAGSRVAGVRGTGIGLAMVHHIVRAHGGTLRVESKPGQGSTFTMLLPAEIET